MYVFIVNPLSGNKKSETMWQKIESLLVKKQVPYLVHIGDSEASARTFLWEAIQEHRVKAVAVIGGDGTLNAVLQDLVHTDTPVALLPAGSGNDIGRMFHLTMQPGVFVKKLLEGKTVPLDALKVNNSYGLTISGVGLDADIAARAAEFWLKKPLHKIGAGSVSYKLSALASIFRFQPFKSTVQIDHDEYVSSRTWMIACGNTSLYGGGLVMCPYAHPADGVLDVTLVHSVKRNRLLFQLFPLLLKGNPVNKNGVTYKKGKRVSIRTSRPVPVMVDGEQVGMTPAHITVQPKAISFIMTSKQKA